MHQILIVVQVLVAIALIGIVLMQQGKGADAGAAFGGGGGGGGSGSLFGARGPASALTRITAILAVVFFVNSISLAIVARSSADDMRSVVETTDLGDTDLLPTGGHDSMPAAPASDSDALIPAAPAADSSGAAAIPAAPSGEETTN